MCVFSLQLLSETFLILRKYEWNIIFKKLICCYVKYPSFLSDFNKIWIISIDFRKLQKLNFVKILPVEAELFRPSGRTDGRLNMTNIIVSFRSFCKRF